MDDVDNSYRELAGRCEWHEGIEVARTCAFEGPRLFSAQYGLAADQKAVLRYYPVAPQRIRLQHNCESSA